MGSGGTDASTGGTAGMGGKGATCGEFTTSNIEGPFFLPDSPERTDIRLSLSGPRLRLRGKVMGPDCEPIAGALVDFWQADEDGAYDVTGDTFRGHQTTDRDGNYVLESIIPGRYLNGAQYRPAHIHVKVGARGGVLTTQLYFPDDPFNDIDPFIDFSLIVNVVQAGEVTEASFDFVLP
jgi:protocatechuate 3,4-dioxygenase beta subunit